VGAFGKTEPWFMVAASYCVSIDFWWNIGFLEKFLYRGISMVKVVVNLKIVGHATLCYASSHLSIV